MGVGERLPQRVLELGRRTEPEAPPRSAHDVRCLAHGLRSAHQTDVALPERDLLRTVDHGLEAGAAETIHGHRGRLDRETCLESDVTRHVEGIGRGLHHVPEHHVAEGLGRYTRALDGGLRGDHAEVDGRMALETPSERAHRSAGGGEKDRSVSVGVAHHSAPLWSIAARSRWFAHPRNRGRFPSEER